MVRVSPPRPPAWRFWAHLSRGPLVTEHLLCSRHCALSARWLLPGYSCALRKQFLGFVLAGSVVHLRCEVDSRMPRQECSQILSNGAFLPPPLPTPPLHASWKFPQEQQVFRIALPPIPTSSCHLAITSPFTSQNLGFFSSDWSPDPSGLVPSRSSYLTGIAFYPWLTPVSSLALPPYVQTISKSCLFYLIKL